MCSAQLDLFTMLKRQGSDFSDAMRKMNPPTHVATMKRGQMSTSRRGLKETHNAKKMYEEAQVCFHLLSLSLVSVAIFF
jgi:hypothetical protein